MNDEHEVIVSTPPGGRRAQLLGLVPEDLLCDVTRDRVVEVEVKGVSVAHGPMHYGAVVRLTMADRPQASFATYAGSGAIGVMTCLVPARLPWNVVVVVDDLGHPPPQCEVSVQLRVRTRAKSEP